MLTSAPAPQSPQRTQSTASSTSPITDRDERIPSRFDGREREDSQPPTHHALKPSRLPCQKEMDELLRLREAHGRSSATPPPRRHSELVAYCIVDREDASPTWIRCGMARVNRDGSVNVRLDAVPLNGELHLRPIDVRHLSLHREAPEQPPPPEQATPLHS